MIFMAMIKNLVKQFSTQLINIGEMISENHFLRVIEKHFEWNFIYDEEENIIDETIMGISS